MRAVKIALAILKFIDYSLNNELRWLALSNLLSVAGNGTTVVIFLNESAGMMLKKIITYHVICQQI